MSQQKFITSHGFRVKRANDEIKRLPVPVSFIDKEAFVESYLLDDIYRLYQYRLRREQQIVIEDGDRIGKMIKERNIEMFSAISKIFGAAVQSARGLIRAGYYKAVWKAIPEGQLKRVANNVKHLPYLRELAVDLLKQLSSDMLAAGVEVKLLDESLDMLADHEANVRSVKGLSSKEEIDAIIHAVEVAIPDDIKAISPKSKINPNV